MTALVYSSRDHDNAVLAAVRLICAGLPEPMFAGDGDVPAEVKGDKGNVAQYPYCVVYPLGSSTFDGPLSRDQLDADAWPTTQVTFNGATREQAAWLQDQVRPRIVGTFLQVAGRSVGPVRLHMELPASRDTTVTPYVYWAVDQYRAFSSPA